MDGSADLRTRLRAVVAHRMETDPAHDLAHLDRVWTNAQAIADDQTDMSVLLAASYLHDLVNLPKDDPDRYLASRKSAMESEPILQDLGYNSNQIRAIQHAIEAHSFSADITPKTAEARVLRDADRLDALGAIGIARNFSVSGALGRTLYDAADPFAQNRPLDDLHFSLDHWKVKLLGLPGDMLTQTGRQIAEQRTTRMIRFLEEFGEEIGNSLPQSWVND
ncbi:MULTISPECIES: HD domain-containing protein [unclassified Ruegeria]|uniref:HD domain-containing protein n=1 Tax=unclassified Ruegeria TaxID=2625375 RepID=UPI0014909D4C|nr:HD domain-containing protein [Ruegeria sp. HKCCD5849]NOD52002.1 HD domain-containing protein [Ruegeria sp. HKCCD5851]NOD66660.1 HD domain-containing protein [Ruegeria sp. HKCCD7303]